MSDYILISGQTVSGVVVSAGTYLEIGSGGLAIDTLVKDGGHQTVFSGGQTISTTVRAGGYETVSSAGSAIGTAVKDGGYLVLGPGGTASSAAISGGGTMIVSAGGVAFNTESAAAAVISITNLVNAGQTVSGVTVGASGLAVGSGGLALSTTVTSGGEETISSGGTASATVVSSGATLEVSSGGSAVSTTVDSGGTFIVLSGGSATATVIENGGQGSVKLVVRDGQVSSGLVVNSVVSVYAFSGGITSGTVVTSGGSEVISASGTEIAATVSAGGFDLISGISIADVVSGSAVVEGGTTSGLTVTGSGSVTVEIAPLGFSVLSNTTIAGHGSLLVTDGKLSNVTLSGNGTLIAYGGADLTGLIVFNGAAGFVISTTTMPFATLSGFTSTNTLDLASVAYQSGATTNFSDGSLVIAEGGQSYILQVAGNYDNDVFTLAPDSFDGTLVSVSDPPCFVTGTLIATPTGAVPIERLAVGDTVLTVGGGAQPIIWIGWRRLHCSAHPDPARIRPVRIQADAFAPARPIRDLYLSPDHAIFAEGMLIPVKHLLNGHSITQVAVDEVIYFHVELPRHAVILAEGLAVESYLDTGDRSAFSGADGPRMLHPVFGSERPDSALVMEALGCAPLRVTGPEVARIRTDLARRAAVSAAPEQGSRRRRQSRRERRNP